MKLILALALISLGGCSSSMVQGVGDRPAYAPKNYVQKGTVKYFARGADAIIQSRREDAFKKMYESCGGEYEVLSEGGGADKTISQNGFGGLSVSGSDYVFIDFKCSGASKGVSPASVTVAEPVKAKPSCSLNSDCAKGEVCGPEKACVSGGIWGKLFN